MLIAVLLASALQVPINSGLQPTQIVTVDGGFLCGRGAHWRLGVCLISPGRYGNFWLIVLGISGGLVFLGMMYGPQAAFFTELFSTEVRYSGASLGYQIGAILGGAFAPTIATILWTEYDIVWVSAYIALASVLALISVMMLTETYQTNLNEAS